MNAFAQREFISFAEAVQITGLSESTLKRFADAGYFLCNEDSTESLIDKHELLSVLNIKEKPHSTRVAASGSTAIVQKETQELIEVEQKELASADIETRSAPETDSNYAELLKLKALNDLQEKYIELKEGEVKSLKEERDWLRTRIEKLEDKAERDQIILVSMSETQRGILTHLDKRKSTFQLALEWVGLLPNEEDNNRSQKAG